MWTKKIVKQHFFNFINKSIEYFNKYLTLILNKDNLS